MHYMYFDRGWGYSKRPVASMKFDLDTDDEDEFDSDLDEDTVFCKLNC